MTTAPNAEMPTPNEHGRYGRFGGRFVPELLMPALDRLDEAVATILYDTEFRAAVAHELATWVGRPTPLTEAHRLGEEWGARIWLKREDLAHTGAHKINNAVGQALLARRTGAQRVVAETGAGQHGVAAAAACARIGMPCTVYMGATDIERQAPNVKRMEALGSTVVPVTTGDRTLRSAINEALRDWAGDPLHTYYLIGSVVGPHPYPLIVRELQSVIGREAKLQLSTDHSSAPTHVVACVGGGSNAIGIFHEFIPDENVALVGVEAGGVGSEAGQNAATLAFGTPGVLHGAHTQLLQDHEGQIVDTHSISAGLDYPGVGPEHAFLQESGRATYVVVSDAEAVAAFKDICRLEGIIPALEPSHALAATRHLASANGGTRIVVCLSGRGDKDMDALVSAGLL
ncbi:MAG: tryptophan synthase subunit beta [Gemmatimonadales bacterium]